MKTRLVLVGLIFVGFRLVCLGQSDLAKKLVGTWELPKTQASDGFRRTLEFTSDGNYTIVAWTDDKKAITLRGTYKTKGDLLLLTTLAFGKPVGEPSRLGIVKLTEEECNAPLKLDHQNGLLMA